MGHFKHEENNIKLKSLCEKDLINTIIILWTWTDTNSEIMKKSIIKIFSSIHMGAYLYPSPKGSC